MSRKNKRQDASFKFVKNHFYTSLSFSPQATMSSTTTTKKRKSDGATTAASKKAKSTAAANAQFVEGILTDASNFELPREGNATRETILQLAQYARSLEEELNSMRPKEKSPTEVAAAATKLAAAARSGITKQMTVCILG